MAKLNRPDWIQFWMGRAFYDSMRSPDANTKHGCVIVDKFNHQIGSGWNGFARGRDDAEVPNERPETDDDYWDSKYPRIVHSETNAVINCIVNPHYIPGKVTAFITGQPCNNCSNVLWNKGVDRWYIYKRKGTKLECEGSKRVFEEFVSDINRDGQKLEIHYVTPDLRFLKAWVANLFKELDLEDEFRTNKILARNIQDDI